MRTRDTLPFKLPVMEHSHARAALPQWYPINSAGRRSSTKRPWRGIGFPRDQRADCGIFAQDYGQAGAIDFFGRAHVGPPLH